MSRSKTFARWAMVMPMLGALQLEGAALGASPPSPARFESLEVLSRSLAITDDAGARQTPFAGFSIHSVRGGEWTLVTFYVMFREVADGEARRRESYWVGRRVTGDDSPRSRALPEIHWASSDRCEGLDDFVRGIGEVITDRLEIGVPGEGDPSETATDNLSYGIWTSEGRFRGTGFATTVSLSAAGGSPIADWAGRGLAATQACWTGAAAPGATTATH